MTPTSAGLCIALLTCSLLPGCGGAPSPATTAAGHDSTVPVTEQEVSVPAAVTQVETLGSVVPDRTSPAAPATESIPSTISRAFPGARSVRSLAEPFPHRVIRDSAGAVLGYEGFSDSAGVTAPGYGGMVPVQVFFDSRGRPVRIFVLDNCETPAYLDLVLRSGLLDSLLVCDPAMPESVDAVTLATTSSRAVIYGVTGLAARVATEVVAKPGSRVR